MHHSSEIDSDWKKGIDAGQQWTRQIAENMGPAFSAQMEATSAQNEAWMLSPEGHAGGQAFDLAIASAFLLFFAMAGGALGARLLAPARTPDV
jgi:hypothetical protein